jgi:hypothetical protein
MIAVGLLPVVAVRSNYQLINVIYEYIYTHKAALRLGRIHYPGISGYQGSYLAYRGASSPCNVRVLS